MIVPQKGSSTSPTNHVGERSTKSFSSGLSSDDDDDDDDFDLQEMKKEFKRRDALLVELGRDVDPTYARVMRENEEALRALKLRLVVQCNSKKQRSSSNKEENEKIESNKTTAKSPTPAGDAVDLGNEKAELLEGLRRALAFEMQNTFRGGLILVLNTVAYSCCYVAVEYFIALTTGNFQNQDLVAVCIILATIAVLRITGGLWEFTDSGTCKRVKFDMHNRLRLGKIDARIAQWFRKHRLVYIFMQVFAFYACYDSSHWLHERALLVFDKRRVIFQNLPSVKKGVLTYASKKVALGLDEETVQHYLGSSTSLAATTRVCINEPHEDCDALEPRDLAVEDMAFLASQLSSSSYHRFDHKDTPYVSKWVATGYYVASGASCMTMLHQLGTDFWSD